MKLLDKELDLNDFKLLEKWSIEQDKIGLKNINNEYSTSDYIQNFELKTTSLN